ncbi:hypothetical protein ASD21_13710 [Caulobacter sp. Root1455]|uniref:DUF805 domain-containing protein n=1 Tax=Caulobacter sp. Root1455 TaxID=1736465 RepID=UPI0006F6D651|nr:DUF805 domain-containing protein [Caulobacter sp. Root1455]KQY92453.1 hypothetical protein ASD21_13710 [Caulobacter sp. Root1455]
MTLMQKLFGFEGRLRRRDYWLIIVGKYVVSFMVGVLVFAATGDTGQNGFGAVNIAQLVLFVPSLWISIAIALKRCHDRDKGGGWVAFFWLVPIVGWIWGFIELGFLDGTQGRNSYGKSPKGIGSAEPLAEVFA